MSDSNNAIAAVFPDRESAVEAREALGTDHFHFRWMAVTKPTETEDASDHGHADATSVHDIEEGSDGAIGAAGRFLSGSGNSLRKALEDHGVDKADAEAIDLATAAHGAVLVVHAKDRGDDAVRIIERSGGRVYAGGAVTTGATTRGDDDAAYATGGAGLAATATPAVTGATSATTATPQIGAEAKTLQLREERLAVDKQVVAAGEARVGTEVTSQEVAVDVPVSHEELFIERRPARPGTVAAGTIGAGETISVPLTKEQVVVGKDTVVREEVAVGQRRVEDVQRVDETLRREELRVDDASVRPGEATSLGDSGRGLGGDL